MKVRTRIRIRIRIRTLLYVPYVRCDRTYLRTYLRNPNPNPH